MEKDINEQNEVVAISKEDIGNVRNFFSLFEIPMPDRLKEALERFEKEETVYNQNQVRIALCEAMVTSNHEAFKDQLFSPAVDNSTKILYESNFDKDLEDTLTKDKLEE